MKDELAENGQCLLYIDGYLEENVAADGDGLTQGQRTYPEQCHQLGSMTCGIYRQTDSILNESSCSNQQRTMSIAFSWRVASLWLKLRLNPKFHDCTSSPSTLMSSNIDSFNRQTEAIPLTCTARTSYN